MAQSITVKIVDSIGLHARPASIVVSESSKFKSEITIEKDGQIGNLKSIMNVMALGVKQNDEVTIKAEGSDEKEAIKALEKTLKDNALV